MQSSLVIDHDRAWEIFQQAGAILRDDHFVYTSGRHGTIYVNKDAVYPHTELVCELCGMLAAAFDETPVDVICGPALGGVILSQWTANHLDVSGVYAEQVQRDGSRLELRRGYDALVRAKRVGVVEDVLTTGGSLRETTAAVRRAGGQLVGAAALVNRGSVTADDVEAPFLESLLDITAESWEAAACPMCAAGLPVNRQIGKGMNFHSST